jgi:hypothetical protein
MYSIDEVESEPLRRLLSGYSDVIKKVFAGRREIVLQWRSRGAFRRHYTSLQSYLARAGFHTVTHRVKDCEVGYAEISNMRVHIDFNPR